MTSDPPGDPIAAKISIADEPDPDRLVLGEDCSWGTGGNSGGDDGVMSQARINDNAGRTDSEDDDELRYSEALHHASNSSTPTWSCQD